MEKTSSANIERKRNETAAAPSGPVVPVSMAFTIGMAIVTGLCAYFGAQQATQKALADVQSQVAVLQDHRKDVDEHVANIDESLVKLNNQMTTILGHFGDKPPTVSTTLGGVLNSQ